METKAKVTLLGLGSMGVKLAELLVKNGYVVTVWNRTITKANAISGVKTIPDASLALAESDLVVVCVTDNEVVKSLFNRVDSRFFAGKTVINFTTGSPKEADELEAWLRTHHATYINAALQVAPDQMGLPDTTIFVSGSEDFMKKYPAFLTLFGGNIKYLGKNARLASALDMASLSWLYGAYIGLIYGAALCQAAGLELPLYSSTISDITPGFTDFFKHQINRIDTGNFAISQSPLSISVGATQRIFEVAGEYQLNTEFPGIIAKMLKQADKMGLSGKELASVIAVVRPEAVFE